MAKISKRIEKSYETYLKYRQSYADRGYGLDRELTLYEYQEAHKEMVNKAKNEGKSPHPARDIASQDTTFSRAEAGAIIKRLQSAELFTENVNIFELQALQHKYKKAKDIYGLQLTREEEIASESERRQRLLERGKEPDYVIQANARALLFNQLRDAGLSYKEADRVLYG